jgi:tripartite-type tricarboxylate transporter receptor subunit TctC
MTKLMRVLTASLLLAFLTAIGANAMAQSYPSKPLRLIVPFGAGGITDLVARILAEKLSRQLGQPVVVVNRPGAGGNIAAEVVAKSPADGYTLLMSTVAMLSVNPLLYKQIPFEPKDLAPVALVANTPHVVVVSPKLQVATLSELVALAKSRPESITFGTAGNGSSPHIALELLKTLTDSKYVHIPFKSGAESVTAVVAGNVDLTMEAIPIVAPYVKAGKLRALAIASPRRSSAMPDVPTAAEAGVPGLETGSVSGIVVPAATPKDIIAKLNRAVNTVLEDPGTRERLANQGSDAIASTPESFQAFIAQEIEKWTKVIRASGMRIE